jgi:hypothetical protein
LLVTLVYSDAVVFVKYNITQVSPFSLWEKVRMRAYPPLSWCQAWGYALTLALSQEERRQSYDRARQISAVP